MKSNDNDVDGAIRIAEVIEASTTEFNSQCYSLYEAPALGSLIRAGDNNGIYGIVCESVTSSMDPSRHPIARGQTELREEDIYHSNPQLSRLLTTEFRAITVGYVDDGGIHRILGPYPPRMHSFVYTARDRELREFSLGLDFLPRLLSTSMDAQDDIIASFLLKASEAHSDPYGFRVKAGKILATHMVGQLPRLNDLLRRMVV